MLTREQIEEGIDDNGIVDDPHEVVETRYAPLEAIYCRGAGRDPADYYFRILGDYQDCFVEIRVPCKILIDNGWTPPAELGDGGPSTTPPPGPGEG